MSTKLSWVVLIVTATLVLFSNALQPSGFDLFGSPIAYNGEKSSSYVPYNPQASLMLTGYYNPRDGPVGNQAGAVYAQGASVGGGTYFRQPQYLMLGSNSNRNPDTRNTAESKFEELEEHTTQIQIMENSTKDSNINIIPIEKPNAIAPKQSKKVSVLSKDEEYEDEEASDEGETDGTRKSDPNLFNYFPVLINFPKTSDGSLAGSAMAVANSYSTGKGGIASSVATAYGGASPKRKTKARPAQKTNNQIQ